MSEDEAYEALNASRAAYLETVSLMIWWPVVQVLEEYDHRFRNDLAMPGVRRFPDGTVCIDRSDITSRVWKRLQTYREAGLLLRQNTQFRALKCFPHRGYQLLTTREYFDRIGGECDFLVTPTESNPAVDPNEYHPDNLRVDAHFWRKPNKAVRAEFESSLRQWSCSVQTSDIFGALGGLIEGTVRWDGRCATFRVEAANQDAVIWLVLSVLNFGAKYVPISSVLFGIFEIGG